MVMTIISDISQYRRIFWHGMISLNVKPNFALDEAISGKNNFIKIFN